MPSPFDNDDNSGGLVARPRQGDNAEPLTITEISAKLKRVVEDQFGFVRLRGELSGVKRATSGHLYCALKDESAVIDGVMWRGNAQRLSFVPEDGIEVVASGKLTTYPGRSKYQIVIDSLEIAGEGALLALLEKTRRRLEAEGLFAPERKKALPFIPRVIGVVTSPTGAVIRDILHRLSDRFPSHVLVWPVLVQGQGSAEQVAAAVRGFSEMKTGGPVPRPDLVIVARGGGSIEDLWGFNEEVVVRAIADCTIPIISAVGHETDTTLADFAADRRAPTPTAAAEMAVPVRAELLAAVEDLGLRQKRAAPRPVMLGRERLQARVQRLPRPEVLLQPQAQKLDDLAERLRRGLSDRAAQARALLMADKARLSAPLLMSRVDRARDRLAAARLLPSLVANRSAREQERFAALERLYLSLNPKAPLARGFVLVKGEGGSLIRSKVAAETQALLTIEFADGSLDAVPVEAGSGSQQTAAPARPAKKSRPPATSGRQEDLFG
ncbi:exodeoxyribonuclease VII large subunit [Altererythrobacter confluentis]|uniref:Exodeoxyribonuclease 7 large subunit n=1 Tax=Allopontixanthobacter confluentis TaxID=1849021 RepID=A0A6L7GH83_9SPHN|nr:exodeoxyribonuclease VII large subunit [Allopontixanthobacter confluentis]MXP15277.1 exodeoxyribonuclease VII large subunit [Allopontixanthobacter confluentis]